MINNQSQNDISDILIKMETQKRNSLTTAIFSLFNALFCLSSLIIIKTLTQIPTFNKIIPRISLDILLILFIIFIMIQTEKFIMNISLYADYKKDLKQIYKKRDNKDNTKETNVENDIDGINAIINSNPDDFLFINIEENDKK